MIYFSQNKICIAIKTYILIEQNTQHKLTKCRWGQMQNIELNVSATDSNNLNHFKQVLESEKDQFILKQCNYLNEFDYFNHINHFHFVYYFKIKKN